MTNTTNSAALHSNLDLPLVFRRKSLLPCFRQPSAKLPVANHVWFHIKNPRKVTDSFFMLDGNF